MLNKEKEQEAFIRRQKKLVGIAGKMMNILEEEVKDPDDALDVLADMMVAMVYSSTLKQENRLEILDLLHKDMVRTANVLHQRDQENATEKGHASQQRTP